MTTTQADDRLTAIARARAASRPEDVIAGVKDIVEREVRDLSPDAQVVDTNYFNHTYMPDFVIEWTDRGRTTSRPVFIRNHVTETSAPREIEALGDREPVVLGLDPIEEATAQPAIRGSVESAPRMLFSDVSSIGALLDPGSRNTANAAPLLSLVRANVLRGGRGLLAQDDARAVVESAALDPESDDAAAQLDQFSSIAAVLFEEAAATRLLRAAEILRLGLASNPEDPVLAAIGGQLSESDLRVLLPYLLERQADITNPGFWSYIGSMMNLQRLEELALALGDIPITPLVVANLTNWTAKRTQLTFNSDFDDETDDGAVAAWRLNAGLLTGVAGRYLVTAASDARRLKGREDGLTPAWTSIAEVAREYALELVDLRGVVRRIRLSAEESGDVARDVRRINETLEDSYSVREIALRPIGADEDRLMTVDFAASTVTAQAPSPLDDMFEVALRLLSHRNPVEPARLATLLGRPEVAQVRATIAEDGTGTEQD